MIAIDAFMTPLWIIIDIFPLNVFNKWTFCFAWNRKMSKNLAHSFVDTDQNFYFIDKDKI